MVKPTRGAIPVASFTDAWIETISEGVIAKPDIVASFTDAWIETPDRHLEYFPLLVASFTDAWIETRWALMAVS